MHALATRRMRLLAPLFLLAVLCAPLAGSASAGQPCCVGMKAPCAADSAPCDSLAVSPCCHAAPAAAWPGAGREGAQSMPPSSIRLLHVTSPPALAPSTALALASLAAPPQLSVVLRN
jgi:hypothetical protein